MTKVFLVLLFRTFSLVFPLSRLSKAGLRSAAKRIGTTFGFIIWFASLTLLRPNPCLRRGDKKGAGITKVLNFFIKINPPYVFFVKYPLRGEILSDRIVLSSVVADDGV